MNGRRPKTGSSIRRGRWAESRIGPVWYYVVWGSVVKLLIQIPCYNEAETLQETLADLPRQLPGVDQIEVLVVDDGSTDGTAEVAEREGVHHLVRLSGHQGLARAFMSGLDACLRLGADLVVNTDADHQYRGDDIAHLIAPLLERRADLVIGDRDTDRAVGFSWSKRWLQRLGSRVVRRLSSTDVADSPSGLRAMSRDCALRLFVHNRFTYTLETVIQAGRSGMSVVNVPIRVNPATRPSRLFRSVPDYLRQAGPVILRAYAMYRPTQILVLVATVLCVVGTSLALRFLFHYVQNPSYSGYVQSLVVGMGALVLALLLGVATLLAELLASNRRLLEELLLRVRRLELSAHTPDGPAPTGGYSLQRTGAAPWIRKDQPRS